MRIFNEGTISRGTEKQQAKIKVRKARKSAEYTECQRQNPKIESTKNRAILSRRKRLGMKVTKVESMLRKLSTFKEILFLKCAAKSVTPVATNKTGRSNT